MQIVQIISLAISFAFLIVLIDFIRRGLLKEKYSILWLASVFAIIVLSLWKDLLDRVAAFAGIAYGPSLLFLVAFAFVLLILLHYSVVISILTERTKTLAQEIALLKAALKDGEKAEEEEEK
jgi:hypothetical protein